MTVPFLDLGAGHEELREELAAAINRVLSGNQFILGPEVEAFEAEFAAYVGARFCIGVGNGLDALEIGLRALGLGPGDEVLVPANTYIATWLAVSRAGGVPVPVEPDERTYNLDPARVDDAVTPRTRAILAVHLYGQPADLPALAEIAERRGLWLWKMRPRLMGLGFRDGGLVARATWRAGASIRRRTWERWVTAAP